MDVEDKHVNLGLSSLVGDAVCKSGELKAGNTLKHIEKLQELLPYTCLTSAFNNTKAFLESLIAHESITCLNTYRVILSSDENNLNALLGFTKCGSSKAEKQNKHMRCREKLQTWAQREAAVSTGCLEVGFALVHLNEEMQTDRTYAKLQTEKVLQTEQFLKGINPDILNQLVFKTTMDIEFQHSKASLKRFAICSADAILDACLEAVRYLKEGLYRKTLLRGGDRLIWMFFLAKAYNRLVDKASHTGVEKQLLMVWCLKSLKLFCDVTYGNEPTLQAQSYAYLGQTISTRKKLLGDSLPDCMQGQLLKCIWEIPAKAFDIAKSFSPEDNTVLVLYGKFLLVVEDDADRAIDVLTTAINKDDNWFPRYYRMVAFKKKYRKQYNEAELKGDFSNLDCAHLEDAKTDGEFCFKTNATTQSLLEYSRILHWLAHCPKEYQGRACNEVDPNGIRVAIDVLSRIESDLGTHDISTVYKEKANCHYLIGELEEALLHMETAVYTNRKESVFRIGLPVVFRQLCFYAIEFVENKMSVSDGKSAFFAVRRLKSAVMSYIMTYKSMLLNEKISPDKDNKYLKDLDEYLLMIHQNQCREIELEVDQSISCKSFFDVLLENYNPKILNKFLDELSVQTRSDRPIVHPFLSIFKVYVAHKMVLNTLRTLNRHIDELTETCSQKPFNLALSLNLAKDFSNPDTVIPSFPETSSAFNKAEKQYDFVVLHADEDKDWVACCLLIQLEHSQTGFKGCIPERDFEPGKTVIQNIEVGINSSNRILLVVSPDTPAKFYEDLEKTQVLTCLKLFNEQHKDTYVLNLGVEKIPDTLQFFDAIDCSRNPMNLNEVREVLAFTPSLKYGQRPLVSIQSTPGSKVDKPEKIFTAKCQVNETTAVEPLQLLRCGFQNAPIYGSPSQLKKAQEILKFGYPQSDIIILYESFVVCYDTRTKISKWVAYHLTPDCVEGPAERDSFKFHEEERIPEHLSVKLADFKTTTDYGRGHEYPAAEAKYSKAAMYDSFTLTNVLPERKKNIMWSALEVYVREKVQKNIKDVRIFTGPVFQVGESAKLTSYGTIGPNNVAVPTHMFKVVIATLPNGVVTTGSFIVRNKEEYGKQEVDNEDENGFSILTREMTININIRTIETKTGIQLDKMMRTAGRQLNENLLELCPFITVEFFKSYEAVRIGKTMEKRSKTKKA